MPVLAVPCPLCASHEVVYTCEPRCCFNHVCTACKASFLLATEVAGGRSDGPAAVDPKESGEPTARCCACRSLDVISLDSGGCVCAACGVNLKLVYQDVEAR